METKPEMTSAALVKLLQLFETAAIPVWLDGGWGVDALLQTQTRTHKDADIVLPVADVPRLQELLAMRGFAVREGKPPNSFVLANGAGLEVDVHAVTFDDDGNGVYHMQNGEAWIYPAQGFSGRGLVGGMSVRCLSPTTQVLCHAHGYVPTEKDFRDMELLEERIGIELPPQLRRSLPEKGVTMNPRIKVITLGVSDLEKSLAFYRDGLGLPTQGIVGTEFEDGAVVFFNMNDDLILALYPKVALAKDARVSVSPPSPAEFSIGHIVKSRQEVDAVMQQAERAGARVTDPAHDRFWGGYSGYFQDLDGHLWEIAWNPAWEVKE